MGELLSLVFYRKRIIVEDIATPDSCSPPSPASQHDVAEQGGALPLDSWHRLLLLHC